MTAQRTTAPALATPRREKNDRETHGVARDRALYAKELLKLARQTAENIVAMGQRLIEAKGALPHGEFTAMVVEDLGWNMSAAQRLMKIARNPVLADPATLPLLPPSREVLYKLTLIPEKKLSRAIADGLVTPAMSMNVAGHLVNESKSRYTQVESAVIQQAPAGPSNPVDSAPPTPETRGRELARQVMEALHELTEGDRERALRAMLDALPVPPVVTQPVHVGDVQDVEAGPEEGWCCQDCDEVRAEDDLVAVRECSRDSCGQTFVATEGRNCPACNSPFTRLIHEHGCPSCGSEEECEWISREATAAEDDQ